MNADIFMCISDYLRLTETFTLGLTCKSYYYLFKMLKKKIFTNFLKFNRINNEPLVDPELIARCMIKRGKFSYFDVDLLGYDFLILNRSTDVEIGFYIALAKEDEYVIDILMDSVGIEVVGNAIACVKSDSIKNKLIKNYKDRTERIVWIM